MKTSRRTKQARATDNHVGARIRAQRVALNMSQSSLAKQLDLTFQQVQKYEKGANRIGAGRLQDIANIFKVPISLFFDGGPRSTQAKSTSSASDARFLEMIDEFLKSADGLSLIEGFVAIKSVELRRSIVHLTEQIAQAG